MAGPWEKYAQQPAEDGPWTKYAPASDPAAGRLGGQAQTAQQAYVPSDIAASVVGGAERGAVGMAGLPGFVVGILDAGADKAARHTVGRAINYFNGRGNVADDRPDVEIAPFGVPSPARVLPQPADVIRAYEGVTGPTYRPQTTAGKYAASVGEMIGGGGWGAPVASVAAGLLSEGAGQLTHGTALEPWARAGGAIAGGLAGSMARRPGSAEEIIRRDAGGMTPAQVDAAEALMRDAAQHGIQLTRAEAAQAVTGGATRLGDLQRLVEGRGELRGFMAERPGQIEAAGRAQFDRFGPMSAQPSEIGPAIGRAAEQEVAGAQRAINTATRPLYQAAEVQRVGPQVHQGLLSDPLYAQTLQEVRSNPALNRQIAALPDDSVGVIDMVQRRMREAADNARVPGQANSGNTIAAAFEDARQAPVAAAETATGSRPGVAGTYQQAREGQEALRNMFLEPLMAGPIGRLAQRDMTTQNAVAALFPKNPVPNSAGEVLNSVAALSRRVPDAARQLVRAHLESQFNRATRDLQGGPNQFGGANFAAAVRGNTQEAANLAAAIQGLPGGQQVLAGFDRFLDIMAATGQRQRAGSLTAYNTEALNEMKRNGMISLGTETASAAGTNLPKRVREKFEQWNLGKNTAEIARILTDPSAAPLFRHLATAEAGSARAHAFLGRLVSMGGTAGTTSVERSGGIPILGRPRPRSQ